MDLSPGQIVVVIVTLAGAISTLAGIVYRELKEQLKECRALNKDATDELRKQSETNARLVEMTFTERAESSQARRRQGGGGR